MCQTSSRSTQRLDAFIYIDMILRVASSFDFLAKKPNLILSTIVSHLALLRHGGVVSPDIHLANQAL